MNFDIAFSRTVGAEGGYVCNPADPGGETCWGVTVAVARANGYQGAMRDLPLETAHIIYQARYWTPLRCNDLPPPLAFQVFDAAVNHGVKQASRWLQSAAVMPLADQDGSVGPKTLSAVAQFRADVLVLRFNAQRLAFYAGLPTWPAFGRGWARRVADNLNFASGDFLTT